jgi:DNA-binding transcriptional MocR family regulator
MEKKRFWMDNKLIDDGWLAKISGNAWKVLTAIARHYNINGTCFPSIRRLSLLIGLHHETVRKNLDELQLHGFLEQLEIRERHKLRYLFTKSARYLLRLEDSLLEKPDTKDISKEIVKEERLQENAIYRGREQMLKALENNPELHRQLMKLTEKTSFN